MDEPWESHARRLAGAVVRPESRWYEPIATTPRHLLVPRWWVRGEGGRQIRDGSSDPGAWMRAAYSDQTLVTRIGPLHADHAEPGAVARGRTTSSSTMPSLVVTMYRYASLGDGCRTLVTTGTGYGTALLCRRIGADHVTSVDVDPYLVEAAAERLSSMGLHPHLAVADLTEPLAGQYDRIVATVSVPCIPAGWLTALRPGGRLVTTISNTGLIIVADKTDDGGAAGHVAWDRASFMATRSGDDYPASTLDGVFDTATTADGEVTVSPLPVLDVAQAWEVWSMLTLTAPGIEHHTDTADDGSRFTWMAHPDGSWARARTARGERTTTVHQGGPRRLYDLLEEIRWRWIEHGELPVYGAHVSIAPEGTMTLSRGQWSATLGG
ncbi:methyltransferase domain-containing protein [Streptomyces glaucescens]|uniref:methyltransferase domain-containing protein n=1 Tax=Streptomyces glaucescens TaxID=1907 RepID=UPI000A3A7710|nr:methyltransferase domain-containing protein [Streptomyces glaucescens]